MYKRLQRCRAELRGGELCSTPQLSQSLLWSRAAASLHAGGGDSVKAGPEGEEPPTREEEVEGEKMQANPAYLPIEMSYKSQESKYINVSSWSNGRSICIYSVLTRISENCTNTVLLTGTCRNGFETWWVMCFQFHLPWIQLNLQCHTVSLLFSSIMKMKHTCEYSHSIYVYTVAIERLQFMYVPTVKLGYHQSMWVNYSTWWYIEKWHHVEVDDIMTGMRQMVRMWVGKQGRTSTTKKWERRKIGIIDLYPLLQYIRTVCRYAMQVEWTHYTTNTIIHCRLSNPQL